MTAPSADRPSIVVVIPTYNERPNIETLVHRVLDLGPCFRVVIVDDGSPDGTGFLADALAAAHMGRIEVIHRPAKGGLGPAYIAGFRRALELGPDLIAQMDADFSHDPAALPSLIALSRDADLVVGSRYVAGGGTTGWPLWRRVMSRMGGRYASAVLGAPLRDLTSGFKVWRPDTLQRIGIDGLRSDGYAFTIEATWRALRHGARVIEAPIVFTDRVAGASKLSRRIVVEAALLVWKLRWEARSSGSTAATDRS